MTTQSDGNKGLCKLSISPCLPAVDGALTSGSSFFHMPLPKACISDYGHTSGGGRATSLQENDTQSCQAGAEGHGLTEEKTKLEGTNSSLREPPRSAEGPSSPFSSPLSSRSHHQRWEWRSEEGDAKSLRPRPHQLSPEQLCK